MKNLFVVKNNIFVGEDLLLWKNVCLLYLYFGYYFKNKLLLLVVVEDGDLLWTYTMS